MKFWNWRNSSTILPFCDVNPCMHTAHTKALLCFDMLNTENKILGWLEKGETVWYDCKCLVLISSRLYVLQGGLAQQEWRVPELLHRLLKYLEPKLTQVYKNVRERIGRSVFSFAVRFIFSFHNILVTEHLNSYTEVVTGIFVCVNSAGSKLCYR